LRVPPNLLNGVLTPLTITTSSLFFIAYSLHLLLVDGLIGIALCQSLFVCMNHPDTKNAGTVVMWAPTMPAFFK
ncbi:MAG: hypothetical protein M0R18_14375, partial [Deltaproteobacteria bacterium]|nr:hypothetical protein [Deltaproteobacteria bacterium]